MSNERLSVNVLRGQGLAKFKYPFSVHIGWNSHLSTSPLMNKYNNNYRNLLL